MTRERINKNNTNGILLPDKIRPVKKTINKVGIKIKENLFRLFLKNNGIEKKTQIMKIFECSYQL